MCIFLGKKKIFGCRRYLEVSYILSFLKGSRNFSCKVFAGRNISSTPEPFLPICWEKVWCRQNCRLHKRHSTWISSLCPLGFEVLNMRPSYKGKKKISTTSCVLRHFCHLDQFLSTSRNPWSLSRQRPVYKRLTDLPNSPLSVYSYKAEINMGMSQGMSVALVMFKLKEITNNCEVVLCLLCRFLFKKIIRS